MFVPRMRVSHKVPIPRTADVHQVTQDFYDLHEHRCSIRVSVAFFDISASKWKAAAKDRRAILCC